MDGFYVEMNKFTCGKFLLSLAFHLGHERWDTNIKLRWKYGHWWLPRRVYIETHTACPHRCSYCPNGHKETRLPLMLMKEEVFEMALKRLVDMDWTGNVGFQRVNEPLIEPKGSLPLTHCIRRTRQVLPKAYIRTNTAGQKLTSARMAELVEAGLDCLVITQHEWVDQEWRDRIEKICREFGRWIDFRGDISKAWWKINFAGQVSVPNGRPWKYCRTILDNIFIVYNGDVPMCFADTDFTHAVGNIMKQDLLSIITAPEYTRIRMGVVGGFFKRGRPELDMCKKCFKGK